MKKAKIVDFDKHITIITSEDDKGTSINHTGKSLLMKSIYYAFGAKLAKYPKNWKNLNVVTLVEFEYKGNSYSLFRYGGSFIISGDNEEQVFLSTRELKEFYRNFFDFRLELTQSSEKDNPKLHTPYPSVYFLPFYIDQDRGWSGNWKSFSEVQMYDNYLLNTMKYYTGITDNEYYQTLLEQNKARQDRIIHEQDLRKCETTIEQGKKYFGDILDINVDISTFQKEIRELTTELNKIQKEKCILKQKLLEVENKKIETITRKENISHILSDMQKDKEYANKNLTNDDIICPVCGTIHKNSISNRYAFEMDIVLCSEELNQCNATIVKLDKDIEDINNQIQKFVERELPMQNALSSKRSEIELRDVLISNGVNALLGKARDDTYEINKQIQAIDKRLADIQSKLNSYNDCAGEVTRLFNTRINLYISALSITDVTLEEEKKIGHSIKADGSDLPKAVLAYTLAYYDLIRKNTYVPTFPLVIDTMLQQEQSTESIKSIFNTLLNKIPEDAQVIIAATNTHGITLKGKKHTFLKEHGLLNEGDYNIVEQTFINKLSKLSDYGISPI